MAVGVTELVYLPKERICAGEDLFYDYHYEPDTAPAWESYDYHYHLFLTKSLLFL